MMPSWLWGLWIKWAKIRLMLRDNWRDTTWYASCVLFGQVRSCLIVIIGVRSIIGVSVVGINHGLSVGMGCVEWIWRWRWPGWKRTAWQVRWKCANLILIQILKRSIWRQSEEYGKLNSDCLILIQILKSVVEWISSLLSLLFVFFSLFRSALNRGSAGESRWVWDTYLPMHTW